VRVEAFADSLGNAPPTRQLLDVAEDPRKGSWIYRGSVPASRPVDDYTIRVIPDHPGVRVPLEMPLILWSR
jgi:starch phosphorylase